MRYVSLAAAACLLFSAGMATAGTKVQGNLVDADAGMAGLAKSKFKLDGKGNYQFGLKEMTDSAGAPAAVTTPGTEYVAVVSGDAQGVTWKLNVLIPIAKAGQAKVKGSAAALLGLVPVGTPVGVLGAEIHEPPTAPNAAACAANIATGAPGAIAGVWLDGFGANPCASGLRIGYSGVVTE